MSESGNKRIARNSMLLYIRMLLVMATSFYTTRVILKALGVEDYGIFGVVFGFVTIFESLSRCLTAATNRYYNIYIGQNDSDGICKAYNVSLRIQILFIFFIFIILEIGGTWYLNNVMVLPEDRFEAACSVFQCCVVSLICLILQTPYISAVMAFERMNFHAVVSVVTALLKLSIAILLSYIAYDRLVFYSGLMVVVSIVSAILYFVYCRLNFPELIIKKRIDTSLFRSMLSFSCWSIIDPFTYIVRDQGSNMVLNSFFGPILNAAYGIAGQISGAFQVFANNLSLAFRPQIIQSYSCGNYQRTKNLLVASSKINYLLNFMVAIPIIFELPFILKFWLGDGYPSQSAIFSAFVIVIQILCVLNEPISTLMVATGKIKLINIASAIFLCSVIPVGFLCLYFGLPSYTIYCSMLLMTVINQISCVIIMNRNFKEMTIKEYNNRITKPCVIFTITAIVPSIIVYVLMEEGWLRLISMIAVSIFNSLTIAYLLCLSPSEKDLCLQYVRKIRS